MKKPLAEREKAARDAELKAARQFLRDIPPGYNPHYDGLAGRHELAEDVMELTKHLRAALSEVARLAAIQKEKKRGR